LALFTLWGVCRSGEQKNTLPKKPDILRKRIASANQEIGVPGEDQNTD
jgi:hypothetical protein